MEKPEILAVHERKLEEFLKKLELWEPFSKGELKCPICGITISRSNIGFIIPLGKEIVVCCSSADCIYKIKKLPSKEIEQ